MPGFLQFLHVVVFADGVLFPPAPLIIVVLLLVYTLNSFLRFSFTCSSRGYSFSFMFDYKTLYLEVFSNYLCLQKNKKDMGPRPGREVDENQLLSFDFVLRSGIKPRKLQCFFGTLGI